MNCLYLFLNLLHLLQIETEGLTIICHLYNVLLPRAICYFLIKTTFPAALLSLVCNRIK
jgi:hypothetical protein